MKRKIIQLCSSCSNGNDTYAPLDSLYALCNDGTVWVMEFDGGKARWGEMIAIPQHGFRGEPEPISAVADYVDGKLVEATGDVRAVLEDVQHLLESDAAAPTY